MNWMFVLPFFTRSKRQTVLRLVGFQLTLIVAVAGAQTINPPLVPAPGIQHSDINRSEFFPIFTLACDPQGGGRQAFVHPPGGLEGIAACNFNTAGFVLPEDLPRCEKLGLGAIVMPSEPAFDSVKYTREWRELSDQEIERRVRAMIDTAGRSPVITGYFIMDEPGTEDFPALAKAVAAVRQYAPGKLAYINLFPNYATIGAPDESQLGASNYTEYLERFVAEVHPQVLSYDNYRVEMSLDLTQTDRAASYYRNLLEVRRMAQEHNLPCLNVVSANQIRTFATPPSPANLQFQAYTTLAAGYRGVSWYTYYQGRYPHAPVDSAGHRTLTWAWLREVNRQVATLAPVMSGLTSTGVFFTEPAPAKGLPLLPGRVVKSVTCDTPLMIGEFKSGSGQDYVMVVNLSLEKSAKFNLQLNEPAEEIQIVSAMDGSPRSFYSKEGCWLTAGQGVLLALKAGDLSELSSRPRAALTESHLDTD